MAKFEQKERQALYALFTLDEHEIREGATSKDKSKIQWFTYIRREAIIQRLDDFFFGEWESGFIHPDNPYQYHQNHVDCAMHITIRGIRREYNGSQDGGGLNGAKGAATDAFKRVASQWGIGLYLQQSPQIWTENYKDANGKADWKKKDRVQAEALRKVSEWLKSLGASGNHPMIEDIDMESDSTPPTATNGNTATASGNGAPAKTIEHDFTPPVTTDNPPTNTVDEKAWKKRVMDLTAFLYNDSELKYNEFEHTASIQKRMKDDSPMGINPSMSPESAATVVLAYRATKDLKITTTEFPQAFNGKSLGALLKTYDDFSAGLDDAWIMLVDHAYRRDNQAANQ